MELPASDPAPRAQLVGLRAAPGRRPAPGAVAVAGLASLLVSLACTGAGLVLATHYPIGAPWLAPLLFALLAALAFARRGAWLTWLPAVLPVCGFATWTGWISFEELDMLVLAIGAGGYAALLARSLARGAGGGEGHRAARTAAAVPLLAWPLCIGFALSLAVACWRGVADAGGFAFGWYQGYHEPMNSVRLAKGFFLACLLLPLWREAHRGSADTSVRRWTLGLALGLAATSLAALWERLAFTGLLDFSSDYRTTAMFWEMQVGGAAFDAFLALTVPFAVRQCRVARKTWAWSLALGVLVLGAYACLTTFSRGVFLAIPVGVAVSLWLDGRRVARLRNDAATHSSLGLGAAIAAAFLVAAWWMFPSSGYRGLLALLGVVALGLRSAGSARAIGPRGALLATLSAIVLALGALGLGGLLPKGAYLAYAVIFLLGACLPSWAGGRAVGLGAFLALAVAAALVCLHWGGATALGRAALPLALAAIVALAVPLRGAVRRAPSLRWQAGLMGGLVALSALVGVFSGGAYMSDRMATGEQDLVSRAAHWAEGIGLLRGAADWTFGMGLGRYPANYFLLHGALDSPGDYALEDGPDGRTGLVLYGGKIPIGWGELLRVSQRVRVPRQPVLVQLSVRSDQNAGVHLEICEKHLLYNANCLLKDLPVPHAGAGWQTLQARLEGPDLARGNWYAPRLINFSIGNGANDTRMEVRDLRLIDASGSELLENGDFSNGMAHWYFSSDRNHLPWHLKNIFVHVLFEQGALGEAFLVLMIVGALWRLGWGSARQHPLAPATAGALVGFLVVGLFDSVVDVPRDAFLFYFLLLQGLTLRGSQAA